MYDETAAAAAVCNLTPLQQWPSLFDDDERNLLRLQAVAVPLFKILQKPSHFICFFRRSECISVQFYDYADDDPPPHRSTTLSGRNSRL